MSVEKVMLIKCKQENVSCKLFISNVDNFVQQKRIKTHIEVIYSLLIIWLNASIKFYAVLLKK